jgi:hypothetical protein
MRISWQRLQSEGDAHSAAFTRPPEVGRAEPAVAV